MLHYNTDQTDAILRDWIGVNFRGLKNIQKGCQSSWLGYFSLHIEDCNDDLLKMNWMNGNELMR